MSSNRSLLLAGIIFLGGEICSKAGEPDRPRGGGAPIDVGWRSPSRDWGLNTSAGSRRHWGHGQRHFSPSFRSFEFGYGNYWGGGFYGGGFGNLCCPYCGIYWCDGCCWGGSFWIPPAIVVNPGYWYGPRPVQNFIGVANVQQAPVAQAPAPQPEPAVAPAVPLAARANPTARERAIKFLQYGDRHFQEGRYREALARYKKAASAAGDMAEAEFRKSFAELMMRDFSDATIAIRRGLAKKPSWPNSGFALDGLFSPAAKAEAYKLLTDRLQATDFDADAHFLLGVLLHFDGQLEAAQAHFLRTVDLLGNAEHARLFLPEQPEVKAAAAVGM